MSRCASFLSGWGALALAFVLASGVAGCRLSQDGVRPPDNRIFFPGGGMVDPSGRWMYVVSSNSDLRYNAGTVSVLDLRSAREDDPRDPLFNGEDWGPCTADPRSVPGANIDDEAHKTLRCCWDLLDHNILNCDEQKYYRNTRQATVRIGSFAGQPVMQTLPPDEKEGTHRRMFVPVRGDTSITMVDVRKFDDTVSMSCYGTHKDPGAAPSKAAPCDENWRITQLKDPTSGELDTQDLNETRIPDEPYALAIDAPSDLLYVGHLRGGQVSMVDLEGDREDSPKLIQIFYNLLNDGSASQGITGLTIKSPGCFGSIYATSRYRPVVGAFVVYGLDGCPRVPDRPGVRSLAIVGTGEILGTGLGGSETRGIAFVRPGSSDPADTTGGNIDRIFILQRTPPAIVAMDAATQTPFRVMEVCQGPTNLTQHRDATGRTTALFVTCFDAGEVYVIDPWEPRIREVISVGRGPISTVLPPDGLADPVDASRAYVIGFGGNNIIAVDLAEGSPTQYHVVQRLGFTSATPREAGPQ